MEIVQLLLIVEAILLTFSRIWIVLLFGIVLSLIFGILAARVRIAEIIIISITDVLEAIPVISFFPIILVFFLNRLPQNIGIELSVNFLILTAVIWNILLGVYEAVSHIPENYQSLMKVYGFSLWQKIKNAYIPASVPKIISNLPPSIASALFYITLSEVISIGGRSYSVFGIGSLSMEYVQNGTINLLWILVAFLIAAIAINYKLIITPLLKRISRYSFDVETQGEIIEKAASNIFVRSVGLVGSQIATSSRRLVSRLTRVKEMSGKVDHLRRRRIIVSNLSARTTNVVVGITLLSGISAASYYIIISGFGQAFITYILDYHYLLLFGMNISYDFMRIAIVYGIMFFTMIPLAIFLGSRKRMGKYTSTIMQILYSIPLPIFVPIIMISIYPYISNYLGSSLSMNIIVIAVAYLSSAAYLFFNAYGSMLTIPEDLKMFVSVYHLSRWSRIRRLILPFLFPSIVTGSMAAIGGMWGGLIISEFVVVRGTKYAVSNGLMKLLDEAIFAGGHGSLLLADAIDIFLILIIIAMSVGFWYRLYSYSKKYTI